MRYLVFILVLLLTPISTFSAEWPENPSDDALDNLFEFQYRASSWSGCAWRENGNVYIYILPEGGVFPEINYHEFTIIQDGIQFDDIDLSTQGSGSLYDKILVPSIAKIYADSDYFDKHKAFDIYYDEYYNGIQGPLHIDDETPYHFNIIVDPPEAADVDPEDVGYYYEGDTIYISLYGNSGYKLSHWSDDGDTNGYRSVVMPGDDLTLTAYFVESQSSTDGGGSSGSSSSPGCFIETSYSQLNY